jgi:hypothetical protein
LSKPLAKNAQTAKARNTRIRHIPTPSSRENQVHRIDSSLYTRWHQNNKENVCCQYLLFLEKDCIGKLCKSQLVTLDLIRYNAYSSSNKDLGYQPREFETIKSIVRLGRTKSPDVTSGELGRKRPDRYWFYT